MRDEDLYRWAKALGTGDPHMPQAAAVLALLDGRAAVLEAHRQVLAANAGLAGYAGRLEAEAADLRGLVLRLSERVFLCHEILARLAERRKTG